MQGGYMQAGGPMNDGSPQGAYPGMPQQIQPPMNVEEDVRKLSEQIKQATNRHEIYKSPFWKIVGQDLSIRQHAFVLFPGFSNILTKYFFVADQRYGNKIFKYVYGKEGTEFERFWRELLKECEHFIRYDEKTHKISVLFYDPIHNVKIPQRSKIILSCDKFGILKNDPILSKWRSEFLENKQLICEYENSLNGPYNFVFATAQQAEAAEKKLQNLFSNLPFGDFCQLDYENIYVTMDELSKKVSPFNR
jgi:hypothetical protein